MAVEDARQDSEGWSVETMTDLKPCPNPHCTDSAPVTHSFGGSVRPRYYVGCESCYLSGPAGVSRNEARFFWNAFPRTRWVSDYKQRVANWKARDDSGFAHPSVANMLLRAIYYEMHPEDKTDARIAISLARESATSQMKGGQE